MKSRFQFYYTSLELFLEYIYKTNYIYIEYVTEAGGKCWYKSPTSLCPVQFYTYPLMWTQLGISSGIMRTFYVP